MVSIPRSWSSFHSPLRFFYHRYPQRLRDLQVRTSPGRRRLPASLVSPGLPWRGGGQRRLAERFRSLGELHDGRVPLENVRRRALLLAGQGRARGARILEWYIGLTVLSGHRVTFGPCMHFGLFCRLLEARGVFPSLGGGSSSWTAGEEDVGSALLLFVEFVGSMAAARARVLGSGWEMMLSHLREDQGVCFVQFSTFADVLTQLKNSTPTREHNTPR